MSPFDDIFGFYGVVHLSKAADELYVANFFEV
jgi:hypothetical protein